MSSFRLSKRNAWRRTSLRQTIRSGRIGVGAPGISTASRDAQQRSISSVAGFALFFTVGVQLQPFLAFLEQLTGIDALLPDPYFQGGGMHQIVSGGILDIHTDFNAYGRLKLYRRLNVLLYLTEAWTPGDGGELELWDGPPPQGNCVKQIPPMFNRLVVFKTDKQSFHGHTQEWQPSDRPGAP